MKRRIVLTTIIAVLIGSIGQATSAHAETTPSGGQFVATTYSRILDTKAGTSTPFAQSQTRNVTVLGTAGIPSTGVSAVLLDVTATTSTSADSWVKIFPKGGVVPTSSVLRFGTSNVPRSSTVAVEPGLNGQISVLNGSGTTDLNIDVQGYFTSTSTVGPASGGFVPTKATPVLDSRTGLGTNAAQVQPQQTIKLQVGGVGAIPTNASAVFASIGARDVTGSGALRIVPTGVDATSARQLMQYSAGGPEDMGAVLPLGSDGAVTIYNTGSQPVHLVMHVQGYFAADPMARGFQAYSQTRLADETIPANSEVRAQIGGSLTMPRYGVGGAMLGIIAEGYSSSGNVEVYQTGRTPTGLGHLNFRASENGVPNSTTAIVRPGNFGNVTIRNNSDAPVTVRLAFMGWFPAARVVSESIEASFREDADIVFATSDWASQAIFDTAKFDEAPLFQEALASYYIPGAPVWAGPTTENEPYIMDADIEAAFQLIEDIPESAMTSQESIDQWLQAQPAYNEGMEVRARGALKCIGAVILAIVSNIFLIGKLKAVKEAIEKVGGATAAYRGIKKSYNYYRDKGYGMSDSIRGAIKYRFKASNVGQAVQDVFLEVFTLTEVIDHCF